MPKPLTTEQDAFGHAIWDHYHGTNAFEIIERSDGLFTISSGPSMYLAEPAFWAPQSERRWSGTRTAARSISAATPAGPRCSCSRTGSRSSA